MIKFLIISLAFFCESSFSQRISSPNKNDLTILYVEDKKKENLAPTALKECLKIDKFVTNVQTLGIEDSFLSATHGIFKCRYLSDTPERPSSLQQRVLQTRRFITQKNVSIAIQQWADDSGYKSLIKGTLKNEYEHPKTGFIIQPDVSPSANQSDVRLRTFERQIDSRGKESLVEVFNKELYQKIFDSFAQQLFVDGIEIPPSEMN